MNRRRNFPKTFPIRDPDTGSATTETSASSRAGAVRSGGGCGLAEVSFSAGGAGTAAAVRGAADEGLGSGSAWPSNGFDAAAVGAAASVRRAACERVGGGGAGLATGSFSDSGML
ncbi:MAG TPA: hypothetical protein VJ732_00905, partial [Bryobacteraceae bacterium]|nr:hypothetical protein [Bryobacteraceae bacterium]